MGRLMERRPDLEPHPASDSDTDGFEVHWAAEPGPIPEDVARDLREISEAVEPVVEGNDGMIGVRFGRRVIVAAVGAPDEAVDIADVDLAGDLVLTRGAKDPTPAGLLLAQVLTLRNDVVVGFARAPEIEGPSMGVLSRLMPALRGANAADLEDVGRVALGRHPQEVRGSLESLEAKANEASDGDDDTDGPATNVV